MPIRGDYLKTKRIEGGWETIKSFAGSGVRVSEDRLAEYEAGGAWVFHATMLRLATALDVEWQSLVDWKAVKSKRSLSGPAKPKPGRHRIDFRGNNQINIQEIFEQASRIASDKAQIVAIDQDPTKVVVSLEFNDRSILTIIEKIAAGQLNDPRIVAVRLQVDVALGELPEETEAVKPLAPAQPLPRLEDFPNHPDKPSKPDRGRRPIASKVPSMPQGRHQGHTLELKIEYDYLKYRSSIVKMFTDYLPKIAYSLVGGILKRRRRNANDEQRSFAARVRQLTAPCYEQAHDKGFSTDVEVKTASLRVTGEYVRFYVEQAES